MPQKNFFSNQRLFFQAYGYEYKGQNMHELIKRLLKRKTLSAEALAKLQIADLIDANKNQGLSQEKLQEAFSKCAPSWQMIEVYNKYMNIEYEIRAMRDIYCDKLDKARLACIGLTGFYMMALHVDDQFLTTHWLDLMRKSKKTRLGPELWLTIHENFSACAAIKGGFVASGKFLKISRLEDALPDYTLVLSSPLETLNNLASQVKSKLAGFKLINRLPDILQPINLETMEPTEEDISKAQSLLVFEQFAKTFDSGIDEIFDTIQERTKYKKVVQ